MLNRCRIVISLRKGSIALAGVGLAIDTAPLISLQKFTVELDQYNTLSQLKVHSNHIDLIQIMLSNLKKTYTTGIQSAGLTALGLVLRPTSTRRMGPVFLHSAGDHCLITHFLFWQTFVLSPIACPLIVHSMDSAIELAATNHHTVAVINNKNAVDQILLMRTILRRDMMLCFVVIPKDSLPCSDSGYFYIQSI